MVGSWISSIWTPQMVPVIKDRAGFGRGASLKKVSKSVPRFSWVCSSRGL
jgi:hypothetical protein